MSQEEQNPFRMYQDTLNSNVDEDKSISSFYLGDSDNFSTPSSSVSSVDLASYLKCTTNQNNEPKLTKKEVPFVGVKKKWRRNKNNHRVNCSRLQELDTELLWLCDQNHCLRSQNYELRNSIKSVREIAAKECTKILNSVVDYCECRCELAQRCKPRIKVRQKTRMGEGCSGQGCGGYTPSGWNKVLNKQRLDCDDPCCISPPCRCPCPCSYCCTCKPKPCYPVAYCCKNNSKRKGKYGRNRSNSRATSPSGDSASDKPEMVDTSEETEKYRPSSKILGELAFQLERRILDYVFGAEDSKRRRFYGYTVNNICDMMDKESKVCGEQDDVIKKTEMASRLKKILRGLAKHGYKINVHGDFAQKMINKYGLLQSPPDMCTVDSFGLNNANTISGLISELACGPHESHNFNILLKSLQYISKCDGRPLFVW